MDNKTYLDIVELLEGQRSILNDQISIITKLINENAEKENMISTLFEEL